MHGGHTSWRGAAKHLQTSQRPFLSRCSGAPTVPQLLARLLGQSTWRCERVLPLPSSSATGLPHQPYAVGETQLPRMQLVSWCGTIGKTGHAFSCTDKPLVCCTARQNLIPPITAGPWAQPAPRAPDAAGHREWVEQVQSHEGVWGHPVAHQSCSSRGRRYALIRRFWGWGV